MKTKSEVAAGGSDAGGERERLLALADAIEDAAAKYGTAGANKDGGRHNAMKLTWLCCGMNKAAEMIRAAAEETP